MKDNCVDCGKHRNELTETPWWHGEGILCKPCNRIRVEKQIQEWSEGEGDHEYTEEIVCPYCGEEQTDSWELSANSGELDCGNCENKFTYERDIQITYSTQKLKSDK
jgi:hypothetical protein